MRCLIIVVNEKVIELKKVIRLTYNVFFWISLFLALPTISSYFLNWKIIEIGIDVGIILFFIIMWRIRKRMIKKEKEEKELNNSNTILNKEV